MPTASFIVGAQDWTPIAHKRGEADQSRRMLPMGDIHALDPEDCHAECTGEAMTPDPANRAFTAWAAGTCDRCSEAISPRAPRVDQ